MEFYYRSANFRVQSAGRGDTCHYEMKKESLAHNRRKRLYSCSRDEDSEQESDADSSCHVDNANTEMNESQIKRVSRQFLEEFDRRFRGKSEDFDNGDSRAASGDSSDEDDDSDVGKREHENDEEDGKSQKKGARSKTTSDERNTLSKEAWLLRERMWNVIER